MKTTEKYCGGSNVAVSILFGKCQMKGCFMNEEKKCLRCGGTNLKPDALQSTGKIYARPNNAKFETLLKTGVLVSVNICFDCGHVEMLVAPERLKLITKS